MVHHLKILPQYFDAVLEGKKTFEVRKKDRPFEVGDIVQLSEIHVIGGGYTGRRWYGIITYVLDDPMYCKKGYVIFGIRPLL